MATHASDGLFRAVKDEVEELLPERTRAVGGGAGCEAFPPVPFQPSNLLNDT